MKINNCFQNFILILIMLLSVGCSDDNNAEIDNIAQTHWEGCYQNVSEVYDIIVVFSSTKNGYSILNKKNNSFTYKKDDKTLFFSSANTDQLNGIWWITKLTKNEFILVQYPYEDNITKKITLKRIY